MNNEKKFLFYMCNQTVIAGEGKYLLYNIFTTQAPEVITDTPASSVRQVFPFRNVVSVFFRVQSYRF